MKKLIAFLIVMTLLGTFVFADNHDQAIKRVQWSRAMSALKAEGEQTKAVRQNHIQPDRMRSIQRHVGTKHQSKSQRALQMLKPTGFQVAEKTSSKFTLPTTNDAMDPDTLKLYPMTPDTVSYIAGDMFVIQIFSTDTVAVKFFMDDGDSVHNEFDYFIEFDMDGDEVKLWDGIEFDETPPGDGVFQVTLHTGNIASDGPEPFFGIQNTIIFMEGMEVNDGGDFLGMAIVGAPDENTSVEGTVMVDDPAPIPAVNMIVVAFQVPLDGGYDDWMPEIAFLAMTDENGYYRIEIPDMYQGEFMIVVGDAFGNYPGKYPSPSDYQMPIMGDISEVNFLLVEGTETIYGVVEDENATGIGDIQIWAWGDYGEFDVTTNPDGTFEISIMPGWWEVGIDEDQIHGTYMIPWSQSLEVFEGGDHPVDFTLYSLDESFTGYVRTSDETPVPDVEIYTDIYLGWTGYYNWTYTVASGDYNLPVSTALQGQQVEDEYGGAWTTSYWLTAWYEDGLITPNQYNDLYAPASDLNFTAIVADASLSGTVYDADSYDPLWDAQIHAYLPDSGGMGLDFWANTDESGYYELPLVGSEYPGLTWQIEVYYPYTWVAPALYDSRTVISGNHYTQDYYISPPATEGMIEGYVYDENGNGIADAHVEFYGPNYYDVYTDGNGYFSVEGVLFGWYTASAWVEGYDPYDIYDVYVGPEPTYLEFWMGSIVGDIFLDGYVVNEFNTAVPGALMLLFNWEYYEPFSLFTDDSGHFELNVKPGWYDIQIGANGFGAFDQSFDIKGDTTLMVTLTSFTMIADTLRGNVVDDASNPLRRVFVYTELYNYTTDRVDYMGYTYTDISGHYKLALPVGNIDATYSKSGFNTEWRSFDWPSSMPEDPIILYSNVHVFGPELIDVIDVPEDHGKQVRLTWKRAEGLQGSVQGYQIWRAIEPFSGPEWNSEMPLTWDFVRTVPVHPEKEVYNVVVPTLYDKVVDDIYWTGFQVVAIGWDNWTYWNSNILAGWSEDNLPPSAPTSLTAAGTGSIIELQWEAVTSEKIQYYTVYRKTATTEFAQIGYATTAEYVDDAITQSEVYTYIVTATDFGLNESVPSEAFTVSLLAIDKTTAIPEEYALNPNYPNPFNPETTIEFALPEDSKVTLTIYNLNGQMVRQLVNNSYKAGYQRVIWNGCDYAGNSVSSGVYIYTLKAGNFSQTRKMILMR